MISAHDLAVLVGALGVGLDLGSTLAALSVPGLAEAGPVARRIGVVATGLLSVGIVAGLAAWGTWQADVALVVAGLARGGAGLRNARTVARHF